MGMAPSLGCRSVQHYYSLASTRLYFVVTEAYACELGMLNSFVFQIQNLSVKIRVSKFICVIMFCA